MRVLICLMLLFFLAPSIHAAEGMINVRSGHDVKITADRLQNVLENKGVTIFARIDHSAGAGKVGMALRPTELLVFGNPKLGTPLMQCQQSVALDLPQKALIWEDAEGKVWLSYNDPSYLVARHRIEGCEEVLGKISQALAGFAEAAVRGD